MQWLSAFVQAALTLLVVFAIWTRPSRYAVPTVIFSVGVVFGVWSLSWRGTGPGDTITMAYFSVLTAASLILWRRDRRRAAATTFPATALGIFVALVLSYAVPVLWMPRTRMVAPPYSASGLTALADPLVFNLLLLSPLLVVWMCYAYHVRRIEPERRVPGVAYALAVVACGGIAGYLGFGLSVTPLCSSPTSGNLCGLGAILLGIISGALAMVAVGVALTLLVRPVPRA